MKQDWSSAVIKDMQEKLTDLLTMYDMDKKMEAAAQEVLHQIYLEQLNKNITTSGPCILGIGCKGLVDYDPCNTHRQYGDEWFSKLKKKMAMPIRNGAITKIKIFEEDGQIHLVSLFYRGYSFNETIARYACDDCCDFVRERAAEIYMNSLVKEPEYLPSDEFQIKASQAWHPDLLDMEYKEFLSSAYWNIIRREVYRRAGYQCQSCGTKTLLHAHHTTYSHRGQEHEFMDDLQALCEVCHGHVHEELHEVY